MMFSWTPHRFSGGALALDVANSVILRFAPERRIDRFDDPAALESFPEAAGRLCAEKSRFAPLSPVDPAHRRAFLALREATDRYFRSQALGGASPASLADLLDAASPVLRRQPQDRTVMPLDAATAHSALRLAWHPEPHRLKICQNCQWLFLDGSRNRSRIWCDMTVCGNRAKATRHYHRQKAEA